MFKFFQCCNTDSEAHANQEVKVVHLTSDVLENTSSRPTQPIHLLTRQDSFDMTVAMQKTAVRDGGGTAPSPVAGLSAITPRQQCLKDRIWLPRLRRYPVPPTCAEDEPEDVRREALLGMYQDFVMDLHKGIHMTQLTSAQDYSDVHCQVLEDLQTLKVDQGSGCIIEFPLGAVSKVYRIVKNDDRWFSAGTLTGPSPMPPLPLSSAEHIVVVEFMRRKLAFVFSEIKVAQRFLMCVELLIRRAQEMKADADSGGANGGAAPRGKADGPHTIAPMFTSYGVREPGERFGRPLLPAAAAAAKAAAPGRREGQPASIGEACGPVLCMRDQPI